VKTKKAIPLLFSVLAVASITFIGVLGNTQTVYAGAPVGFSCTISPNEVTLTLEQGETSAVIIKLLDCNGFILSFGFDFNDCFNKGIVPTPTTTIFNFQQIQFDETITNEGGAPGVTHCDMTFSVTPFTGSPVNVIQKIWIETGSEMIMIGGELLSLDTTALLLAGAQMNAAWLIPVIVVAIGFAIVIARKH